MAGRKLYIRGLPWLVSEDEIRDFFKESGEMVRCEQPLTDDGRASGTAFLTFATVEGATEGLKLDQATFGERWLSVKLSSEKPKREGDWKPSEKQAGCTQCFIGNLSWDVDEQTIRDFFGACGEIKQIRFSEDRETGRFKGFGHVEFESSESTDAAVALAGQDVCGRPIRVDFAAQKAPRTFTPGGGDRGDRSPKPSFGGSPKAGGFGGKPSGGAGKPMNKNKGSIVASAGKKITF